MRLIVGLGNPGRTYAKTRHNVGFRVVERLAARHGVSLDKRQFEALVAQAGPADARFLLVLPQTYMNESGRAVRSLAGYYKATPEEVLVIADDLALPPGKLRLRGSGSSGGQKGLASIIRDLGTDKVARLRIGIGAPPPPMDAADYVLAKLDDAAEAELAPVLERAAECAELWRTDGLERAMAVYNVDPEEAKAREERKRERKALPPGSERAGGEAGVELPGAAGTGRRATEARNGDERAPDAPL